MTLRTHGACIIVATWLTHIAGCGGGIEADASRPGPNQGTVRCPSVGFKACPNDPGETQGEADQCNHLRSDAKCGNLYVDFLSCAFDNVVCGPDGKYDSAASAARCMSSEDAYAACVIGAADGGGD